MLWLTTALIRVGNTNSGHFQQSLFCHLTSGMSLTAPAAVPACSKHVSELLCWTDERFIYMPGAAVVELSWSHYLSIGCTSHWFCNAY